MGRSVSTPRNATAVAYSHVDFDDDIDDDFDWVVDNFQYEVRRVFPSARSCSEWLGREDHAVMENGHAYFGISEYCGLVAYWMVPKDDRPLAEAWCHKAAAKFEASFGDLRKLGTFSNGEAVFARN